MVFVYTCIFQLLSEIQKSSLFRILYSVRQSVVFRYNITRARRGNSQFEECLTNILNVNPIKDHCSLSRSEKLIKAKKKAQQKQAIVQEWTYVGPFREKYSVKLFSIVSTYVYIIYLGARPTEMILSPLNEMDVTK